MKELGGGRGEALRKCMWMAVKSSAKTTKQAEFTAGEGRARHGSVRQGREGRSRAQQDRAGQSRVQGAILRTPH